MDGIFETEQDELENLLLCLSGGMPLDHLTEDEIQLFVNRYGQEWRKELGYED